MFLPNRQQCCGEGEVWSLSRLVPAADADIYRTQFRVLQGHCNIGNRRRRKNEIYQVSNWGDTVVLCLTLQNHSKEVVNVILVLGTCVVCMFSPGSPASFHSSEQCM